MMNISCPFSRFKNALGEANKGVHQYKVLNTAIVDYILTLLGAFALTYFSDIPLVLTTVGLFIMGMFLHILFGVNTDALQYLNVVCKTKK